jgi:hypothetical protein
MALISYVKIVMRQAVTHIRVVVIWIDIHHAGEIWYTQHVHFPRQSTYATRTLPVGSPRTWQPFMLTQQSWTDSLLLRKVLPTPPLSPTEWPTGLDSVSLPNTTIKVVHLSQTSVDEQTTSIYWAHITNMWSVRSILASGGQPIGP